MSLTKVNYIDNSTIITAQNLNDIQDNIIQNTENLNNIQNNIKKATSRNLLNNSDFTNPVNQRRLESLVANGRSYQYFLDRWCHADFSGTPATFTLTDEGMAVLNGTGYFYQRYEKGHLKSNTAYTLAIYYADGTLDVRKKAYPTFVVSVTNENYDQLYFTIDAGKTVSKAALYEGEYTIDTLPVYQPKEYAVELAECQRYYQVHLIISEKSGWDYTNRVIPVPCAMRTIPTITHTIMEGSGTVEAVTAVNNQFIYLTCSDIKTYMGVLVQLSADL